MNMSEENVNEGNVENQETTNEAATVETPVEATTEETSEAVEEKPVFNPEKWLEGFANEAKENEESFPEVDSSTETPQEPVAETPQATEAPAEEIQTPIENNDVSTPEDGETGIYEKLSQETGLPIHNYDSLANLIKSKEFIVREDETLNNINRLTKLEDTQLVEAYLNSDPHYTAEDVAERVEIWKNNGELKFEAKKVRSQIEGRKQEYLDQINKQKQEEVAKRKQTEETFRSNLSNTVSKTDSIYDGAYSFTDSDKKEVVNYIMSGEFQKEVLSNYDKLVEAAHFMKNREKAINTIRQEGVSNGTQKVLQNIRPVNHGSSKHVFNDSRKTGKVDIGKFISGLAKPQKG